MRELKVSKLFVMSFGLLVIMMAMLLNPLAADKSFAEGSEATTGGTIFIGGENGVLYKSVNGGQTWKKVAPSSQLNYSSLYPTDEGMAVIGGNDRDGGYCAADSVYVTLDGNKWSRVAGDCNLYTLTIENGKYVAAGGSSVDSLGILSKGFTSSNGTNWSKTVDGYKSYTSPNYYESGKYIGIADASAYGADIFVLMGNSYYETYFVTSTDAYTWSSVKKIYGNMYHMIFENNQFTAVGKYNNNGFTWPEVAVSQNGVNWSTSVLRMSDELYGGVLSNVTYGNGIYVAVGTNYWNRSIIVTSTNGVNWNLINTSAYPTQLKGVDFDSNSGTFIAVGNGIVLTSQDGATWSKLSTAPYGDYNTVAIFDGILQVNEAPVLNPIGNKTVNEGSLLQFKVSGTDPDGDPLTYTATNLPPGATFDPATGIFRWTPDFTQAGSYPNVQFNVSDGNLTASESITITVNNVNRPPVLNSIGNKTVDEGTLLQFTVSGTDPDGDPLTYTASNLPPGATFDPATGIFSWTPDYTQAGTYPNIQFTVSDGKRVVREFITITVNDVNRPPVINPIGDRTVDEGTLLQFTVSGTDTEGDPLTYTASNLPAGATFDPATGLFSWTPDYTQAGTYPNVQFTISDGNSTVSESITITVNNVNRPPVLNPIEDKTVDEGVQLQFTVSGTDPDGDPLTYTASNLPAGATFDPATGVFSWTPGYTQAGTYPNVTFVASDGNLTSIGSITIIVNDVSPSSLIDQLIAYIKSLGLANGRENSFITKLENAKKSLGNENENAAINQMEALGHEMNAQRGNDPNLTDANADYIIEKIQVIISVINL